jgi:hypothetical protein
MADKGLKKMESRFQDAATARLERNADEALKEKDREIKALKEEIKSLVARVEALEP